MEKTQITATTFMAALPTRLAVAAAALLALYYRTPLLFLLLTLCLTYLLWGYYWTWASSNYTLVEKGPGSEQVFTGDTITREIRFANSWILPIARCRLQLFIPSPIAFRSDQEAILTRETESPDPYIPPGRILPKWDCWNLQYTWLPKNQNIRVNFQLTPHLRGNYYLPPSQLLIGDPSGLYFSLRNAGEGQYLTVFPRRVDSETVLKPLVYEGEHRENNYGMEDLYDLQGVRDYQPGDPWKQINWPSSARTGHLKTNLYTRKNTTFSLVVLDLSAPGPPTCDANISRAEDPALEKAISLASSLALYHLEQGAKTSFATNAPLLRWVNTGEHRSGRNGVYQQRTPQITSFDYSSGTGQARRILELCATIDDTGRALPEDQEKLWFEVRQAPAGTLIYILGYHLPPAGRDAEKNGNEPSRDLFSFYSSRRISSLPSSHVRLINLSLGGESK